SGPRYARGAASERLSRTRPLFGRSSVRSRRLVTRDASLERTSYGSLLDSPESGALRDRGTTRRPTIPRQGSGRRVSSRLAVTRAVTAGGHPPVMLGPPRRGRSHHEAIRPSRPSTRSNPP